MIGPIEQSNTPSGAERVGPSRRWARAATTTGGGISLALDGSDDPHIVYYDGGSFEFKYTHRAGGIWTSTVITLPDDPLMPYPSPILAWAQCAIAVDKASGAAHIALLMEGGASYVCLGYWRTCYADAIIVDYVTVTGDGFGGLGYHPSIALDTNGFPGISYQDKGRSLDGTLITPATLKYAQWDVSHFDIETIAPMPDVYWEPNLTSLAFDPSNRPHIAYLEYLSGYKHAIKNGGTWTIDAIPYNSGYPSLSMGLDATGGPHLSLVGPGSVAQLAHAYWNGTVWVLDPIENSADHCAMAVDRSGFIHIAYDAGGILKYASNAAPQAPSVTATSPNGGESWIAGSSHDITWTSTGAIANVKIEYSTDNGANWTEVVASTPNDGVHPWTVPGTPSVNCLVRASDPSNATTNDVSNAVFTISAAPIPTITLTSPNGGESWIAGSTHDIAWTSTGTIANVRIQYSNNNGSAWSNIIATTPNDGSYSWTIPNVPSSVCLVVIYDASNASVADVGNAVFTIAAAPSLTVATPNGGESWAVSSAHNITWTSTGAIANAKIEYSANNGAGWATIIASTPNEGTHPWTVPNAPSTACLVRVSDASNTTVNDASNAAFTIRSSGTEPTLTMTSPNGGESWAVGSSHDIAWTSTGTIAGVKIEYSTNNGAAWTTVIASTPNDGAHPWAVPGPPSSQCLVRVSDASNAAINDLSQAAFLIVDSATYTISGTVTSGGSPLPNVVMNGLPGNPATNAAGTYSATVGFGWMGTATPTLAGFAFIPSTRSYADVTANRTGQDYAAGGIAGTMTLAHVPSAAGSGVLVEAVGGISGNQAPVSAFGFEFVYDAALFDYQSVAAGTLTGDWISVAGNDLGGGRIRIGGFPGAGTAIPPGTGGSLVKVKLRVKNAGYGNGTTATSRIEEYTDSIAAFTPLPQSATFTYQSCPDLGDINGDGLKTPGDAQKAFNIYLGALVPTSCQATVSDANCDGATTPGDAQKIFEHYLARIVLPGSCAGAAPAPEAGVRAASVPGGPARRVRALGTIGRPGDEIVIPVMVSGPGGLREFSFDLAFRTDLFEFKGVMKTPLTEAFEIEGLEIAAGIVRISGQAPEPVATAESEGAVVCVVLEARTRTSGEGRFFVTGLGGDLAGAEAGEGTVVLDERPRALKTIAPGPARLRENGVQAIPIELSEVFGLAAFGAEIGFDPQAYRFMGVRRTRFTEGFIGVDGNEISPGILRIGGYAAAGVQKKGTGEIVELLFLRLGAGGGSIEILELTDDLRNCRIQHR